MEKLRAYISIVKDRFQPVISDGAALLLERHYEKIRSAQTFVIPVTVRFLESLIRLTQAHARLMYRNTATLEDAVAVLRVMECSAYAYGGFDGSVNDVENVMYCDPMSVDVCGWSSPDEEFVVFEYQILKRYDMLDHMSDNRRQQAQDLLEGDDNGGTPPSQYGGWNDMENARDRSTTNTIVHHDHYGRSYVSPPNTQTPSASKRRRM